MLQSHYDTLIFDIGDVLFTWSPDTRTSISPKVLHNILDTATWFEYEKGNISEDACYDQISQDMNIPPEEIRKAFQEARDSLESRPEVIDLIRQLKPSRKVYAMSNISAPDYAVLKSKRSEWDLFDRIFTSSEARERKPNLGFYRYVLEQMGPSIDPSRAIFIDDKPENVLAARSFGITGIHYDTFENVQRALLNLCLDPVERGFAFMRANARKHYSYTSTGEIIQENFAQLLILEAMGDPSMVEYTPFHGPFNFFRDGGLPASTQFPCDADTTSIGFTVLDDIPLSTKHHVMDDMLNLRNADSILQVYFDASRPRIDPIVCVNVLTLFYTYGRGDELRETFQWVESVLKHRAYLDGTRYYEPAEAFLFFMSRLLSVSPRARESLGPVFKERCRERLGAQGDALALAMRVICCVGEGIDASRDLESLLQQQQIDGGWKDGWSYRYGTTGIRIANRGLTTALAVNAIKMAREGQDK